MSQNDFDNWIYRFGDFEFDPRGYSLTRCGEPVMLRPKGFQLLRELMLHAGDLVDKDSIMDAVWPNITVGENNLTVLMANLRKALGDSGGNQRHIITLPGRGYRFAADFTRHERAGPHRTPWASNAEATVLAEKLAILPFVGYDLDDMVYLEAGLTDALTRRASRLPHVIVYPVSTTQELSEEGLGAIAIGRKLGADAVLSGSIRKDRDLLRVRVQLQRVDDGASFWADEWDDTIDNVFALEDAIAERLADALTRELSGSEARKFHATNAANPAAYQSYLRGRAMWYRRTSDGIDSAIREFESAIDLDPSFAMAHAGLADCFSMKAMHTISSQADMVGLAKKHSERALSLDSDLPEATTSLAFAHFLDLRWRDAGQLFEKAIRLDPNNSLTVQWYADFLTAYGRLSDGIAAARRSAELNPASAVPNENLGFVLYLAGCYEEAVAPLVQSLELDPYLPLAHGVLGLVYLELDHCDDAIFECERAIEVSGENPFYRGLLGYVHGVLGDEESCRTIAKGLVESEQAELKAADAAAICYAGLHDVEKTLTWLETAVSNRCTWSTYLTVFPQFDFLHNEERFQRLCDRYGFTVPVRRHGPSERSNVLG